MGVANAVDPYRHGVTSINLTFIFFGLTEAVSRREAGPARCVIALPKPPR